MLDIAIRLQGVFALAAGATAANEPSVLVVVVTGVSLVFSILVILWLLLTLEGKLFSWLDDNKKNKELAKKVAEEQAVSAPVATAAAPAPVVEEGIPPEVVAAIAAAVANIEGGKYTLRSVQAQQKGRGQWGFAGVVQATEPF